MRSLKCKKNLGMYNDVIRLYFMQKYFLYPSKVCSIKKKYFTERSKNIIIIFYLECLLFI